jgi:hypothetical protein
MSCARLLRASGALFSLSFNLLALSRPAQKLGNFSLLADESKHFPGSGQGSNRNVLDFQSFFKSISHN